MIYNLGIHFILRTWGDCNHYLNNLCFYISFFFRLFFPFPFFFFLHTHSFSFFSFVFLSFFFSFCSGSGVRSVQVNIGTNRNDRAGAHLVNAETVVSHHGFTDHPMRKIFFDLFRTHAHRQISAGARAHTHTKAKKKITFSIKLLLFRFGLISLFNDISTFVGYLMLKPSLIGWGCRIHRLHLCRGVRPPPQRVSWI